MSKTSRREILKNIALSVSLGGMPFASAQLVHNHVAETKQKSAGVYNPKLFNPREYKTVAKLAELIIPKDEVSGSAVEAGAPEFIDLIGNNNEDLATTLVGGIQWLDITMQKRHKTSFLDSTDGQQREMLDLIAYQKNAEGEFGPGVLFFDWMRRLTADAFYTSPIGIKDIDYMGNKGMTVFQVPKEAIAYALKKSGL